MRIRAFLLSLVLLTSMVPAQGDVIDHSVLPDFYDSHVPSNTLPALKKAASDYPKPYLDGCHTQQNMDSNTSPCAYGVSNSKTVAVLFGDSHALSWFPAVEKIALQKKWKLYSLTMSSCWPANILAYNSTTSQLMDSCPIWRASTLELISKLQPKYIFIAGTSGFSTVGDDGNVLTGQPRTDAWVAGMTDTLMSLVKDSKVTFYISDYPVSIVSPVQCLLSHPNSIKPCTTPAGRAFKTAWLQTESDVATKNGAVWIDPTEWICQSDPCSPLSKNFVIYRDAGHLTSTFARTLAPQLFASIKNFL